ncbi:MAG: hypothetical protein J6X66_09110, partial [Lachnospiraceae bacterium]|nr:hypothetical protein [Lachnospiraceae bacterium]
NPSFYSCLSFSQEEKGPGSESSSLALPEMSQLTQDGTSTLATASGSLLRDIFLSGPGAFTGSSSLCPIAAAPLSSSTSTANQA